MYFTLYKPKLKHFQSIGPGHQLLVTPSSKPSAFAFIELVSNVRHQSFLGFVSRSYSKTEAPTCVPDISASSSHAHF